MMRLYFLSLLPGEQGGILFQSFFAGNRQFLATFPSAAGQYFTAIGSFHTLAKTVNGFTAALVWLKCTFHVLIFLLTLNMISFHAAVTILLPVKGRQR